MPKNQRQNPGGGILKGTRGGGELVANCHRFDPARRCCCRPHRGGAMLSRSAAISPAASCPASTTAGGAALSYIAMYRAMLSPSGRRGVEHSGRGRCVAWSVGGAVLSYIAMSGGRGCPHRGGAACPDRRRSSRRHPVQRCPGGRGGSLLYSYVGRAAASCPASTPAAWLCVAWAARSPRRGVPSASTRRGGRCISPMLCSVGGVVGYAARIDPARAGLLSSASTRRGLSRSAAISPAAGPGCDPRKSRPRKTPHGKGQQKRGRRGGGPCLPLFSRQIFGRLESPAAGAAVVGRLESIAGHSLPRGRQNVSLHTFARLSGGGFYFFRVRFRRFQIYLCAFC